MPFAEFQAGNAGLALPTFGLQSAEATSSLMERAQRRRMAEQDFVMRREKHVADMATSDLTQQSLRAEIGLREANLRENERVTKELANVREDYSLAASAIDEKLAQIQNIADPFEQRRLMTQLEGQAARYSKDPHISAVLQKQIQSTHALIDANEKSKLQEYISTTRFATNEVDARAKFPGQGLRLVTRPNPMPGQPPMTFYIPTGQADPETEAQAMSLLNIARASGDLSKIEEIQKDPAVQTLMRVPGSNFSNEYMKAVQAAAEFQRKREKDKRDAEDQKMQEKKFRDEQNALTVPGFTGQARSGIVAAKMAEESAAAETSMGLIYKLEDITKIIANDPKRIADPALSGEAEVIAKLIQSTNRIAIVGPGAVTPEEWKMLEKFAANPTDAKTLIPFFRERAKKGYEASRDALFNKMATTARQNGIDVDPRYWSRQSIMSRRVSPDGPSTNTNTVTYKGKPYTVVKQTSDGMLLVKGEDGQTYKIPNERSSQSQPAQGNARP